MNMLSTKVKNIRDLMSIALQAEREAVRRYSLLAKAMRKANNKSTADLFERMVIEEQDHEQLLLAWMEKEGIEENPDIGKVSWHDPNISTTYRDEARDPYQSSPYKALAFAVHNEEIAFRFYTHVAANSSDNEVRKFAETLAQEELEHMALLRAERRRAYHIERDTHGAQLRLDPKAVHRLVDLLSTALYIDRFLLSELSEAVDNLPEIGALAKDLRLQIEENERLFNKIMARKKEFPGEAISKNLEQLESYKDYKKDNAVTQESKIQRLYSHCDQSFSFYNTVVETASDEKVMLTAQDLSSVALNRLTILENIINKGR